MTYPNTPGHKAGAPETSKQAASEIRNRATTLREAAMSIFQCGWGLTADQLAKVMEEHPLAIRPRVSELRAMGLVRDTGVRRRNASGKMAAVWAAVK